MKWWQYFAEEVEPNFVNDKINNKHQTSITDGGQGSSDYLSTSSASGTISGPAEVVSLIYWVVGILAVTMIAVSGIMYMVSAGNEARQKKAKNALAGTIIGLVIATLAGTIVGFVLSQIDGNVDGETAVKTTITNFISIVMWLAGALSVVMLIIGGIMYATSAGDDARQKAAKKCIVGAIIGLALAVLAGIIVGFVLNTVQTIPETTGKKE
jgi:cytochrome bd-type quinol oxidase subunit 2